MSIQDGWQPDPSGRHEYRHYARGQPTTWVSNGGVVSEDALAPDPQAESTSRSEPQPSTSTAGWYRNASNPDEVRFWDGAMWTEHIAATPVQSPTIIPRDAMEPSTPIVPRNSRRSKLVLAGLLVVALVIALASLALAQKHDGKQLSASDSATTVGTTPQTATPPTATTQTTVPASTTTTTLTPSEQVRAWWTATGDPDLTTVKNDVQTIADDLSGAPSSLPHDCQAFSTDVKTALAAPPAPVTNIEQEWQSTFSSLTTSANDCVAGNYSQASIDLGPSLNTIPALTDQVNVDIGG